MTEPVRVGEVLPDVVAEAIARAGPGYYRWMEQVTQTGYCAHPVRLRGTVDHADRDTGEVRTVYDTEREPDNTLLKACGNRRASVCSSCSATYQADQFHLLAAGMRGGKGIPETVSGHPRLFVTFTAPSFGPVHTRRAQGLLVYPRHPYRQGQRCPHGRRAGCWQRHDANDPKLGEPMCPRCYQAGAQVLWNALAGRLWSRTTIYLYRALAQLAGLSEAELRALVRISFAKVAEYQKRGAVHFHAVIRLDAWSDCGCPACVAPPPPGFTADLLEQAVRRAAATVAVRCPMVDEDQGVTLTARWGEQLDVRHITEASDEHELSAEQVAGYVAKYATKATEALGVTLDHRIGEAELDELELPAHVVELVRACLELGGRPGLVGLRLRGTWTDPMLGRVQLADWYALWRRATVELRPNTEARDERLFRLHILPRFGSMPLVAITQYEVRVWVTHATRQGLAASTVRRAYQLLGKVMAAAVDAGMIAQNPCRRVPLPRIERREMRFLTPVEVARLADSIRPSYRALVLLGAYGGLRIGEMAGLRRGRVDLDQGMVEVVEIVTEVSGYLHFGPPKTRAGYRRVGLPRVVVEALAEQLSGSRSADDLVFCGTAGWHAAAGRIPASHLAAGDQGGRAGWAAHP